MNSLVEKAFRSLTTTCNITLLHPNDEDRIKVTLKALHNNDVRIDSSELEAWLVKEGWSPKPIKNVALWLRAIANGGRVQLKYKAMVKSEEEVWKKLTQN